MPYTYEVVQELYLSPEVVWTLEYNLKKYIKNNNLHYLPKLSFGGYATECYSLNENN